MTNTTYFNLNLVEGSDIVNPLVQTNPNFETIDGQMYANSVASIHSATEIKSGSVHVITRQNPHASMIKFIATTDFVAGETFTVDGVQVTAYTTDGQPLTTNCYRIGTTVLAHVGANNVMTVFVSAGVSATAENAEKLEGHPADYFATAAALTTVQQTASSAGALAALALPKSALVFDASTATLTITL